MSEILSELVTLQIREVGGSTWKDLVCLTALSMPLASQVNTTDTIHCGPKTAVGNITLNPTGTALTETDINANTVTFKEMKNWQLTKTLIEYKVEYPGSGGSYGADIFLYSTGFVTATDLTLAPSQNITFTFTITGNSTPVGVPF
jgi:hypothetical protein